MPRVSIFVPSYNHASFVTATIQSVQAQTFQDFEIVVTDDGSQDGTPDIIASLHEPRLSLHRFSINRGACAATNDAVRRCQGEYLSLLNSDDCFLPHKLAKQVAFLDAHPEIGAVFAYPDYIDEDGVSVPASASFCGDIFKVPNRSQSEWLRQFFFAGNCLCHPTIMIRRCCYEQIGLYDERLAQLPDFDMWIRLVNSFPIHIMPEPLIKFRVLPNGRNMSALRVDSAIRSEWESALILLHYLSLSPQMFAQVFTPEIAALSLDMRENRMALLGRICLATNQLTLHRFGMELLHSALPPQGNGATMVCGVTHRALIHMTGDRDIYNVLAKYKIADLEQRLQRAEAGQQTVPTAGGS